MDEIGEDWPPLPSANAAPEQDGAPRVVESNGQVDAVPGTPSAAELKDRVKQQALTRLRKAIDRLSAAANRFPDLDGPSRTLKQELAQDLAEIDLLEVHLELEELRGIFERRDEREGEDRLPPDVISALDRVGLVGPGLTLDNAEVEAFEARRGRYFDLPSLMKAVDENDALSQAIAADPTLYGEGIRAYTALFLRAGPLEGEPGRLRAGQYALNRNTVLTVSLMFASGVSGGAMGGPATEAMRFLAQNAHAISAMAPGWGEAFQAWITPILMRAQNAYEAYKYGRWSN